MSWWYEDGLAVYDYDKDKGWQYRPVKEEKMEFDKSRCYSALNADELRAGDKVIVADCIADLKNFINDKGNVVELEGVRGENCDERFRVDYTNYSLAYLVERAENCTNCENRLYCVRQMPEHPELEWCENYGFKYKYNSKTEPKAEKKEMCLNCKHYNKVNDFRDCTLVNNPAGACPHYEAEKHYRPFRDTDELIKVWDAKIGTPNWGTDGDLTMPHVWVREKGCDKSADLITCYGSKGITVRGKGMYFDTLFTMFEFLDGSPCGVEE